MENLRIVIVAGIGLVALAIVAEVLLRRGRRDGARPSSSPRERGLGLWLGRAGYRSRNAVLYFVAAQIAALVVGAGAAAALHWSDLHNSMIFYLQEAPGGVGYFLVPLAQIAPILVTLLITSVPFVVVRRARRRLVRDVNRQLTNVLELLATLARAGLGFDAALERLLESGEFAGTHLGGELARFYREIRAGTHRERALRDLAHRNDVSSLTLCTSALIQAQVQGLAISEFLRQQASDVQARRRERALTAAQSLPAKLAFPLVLCFLPGLFLLTLGPAFAEFFRVVAGVAK